MRMTRDTAIERGTRYEEVSDVFTNFGLECALSLEPSSLDLSGMSEGYYCAILLKQDS